MSEPKPWKRANHRIVIEVDGHPWLCGNEVLHEQYLQSHAEDLLKIVRPLAETLSSHYKNARLESDRVCRFCGHEWEAALDEKGDPICCESAMDMRAESRSGIAA